MEYTERIAHAALNIARHIHDTGYEGVIVSGGSHELSAALLALAWGTLYPDTRQPRVYVIDAEANALLYKRHEPGEHPREFEEWMNHKLPELAAAKDRPLCFLDDFALGGEKDREVSVVLKRLGFTNLGFAYFGAKEDTELETGAFVGERSTELVAELRHIGQHIQGKPDAVELLDEETESPRLRTEALETLREVGRGMKHKNR